jgi:DNA-binding response OmpR family regulator
MRSEPPSKPLRVLVVEDYADQADSLAMLLRLWGYDCRIAGDGATALETASTYQPDLVLLDLQLPKVEGLDVARWLRERAEFQHVPLVAITGFGQEADQVRARAAGVDQLLLKPADPQELRLLLDRTAALSAELRRLAVQTWRMIERSREMIQRTDETRAETEDFL